ncbi:f77cb632-1f1f-4aab-b027-1d29d5879ac1 [Thermothielavioides terrestris]|nr:f77cb632-1f1f-4aab-b027-1d29d5879ac1 [Thermothielavioides terrestris]
MGEGEV